ncbi:hypothetical protein CAPTEDRAFT_198457 [Capitella teleta]|uniref:Methyltransferase domain-containing protein n=1 Tax=Capitella teleta TaxID=283909 RepID=R7U2Q8_CAPTE|nr:hypothetical protein CAPTEDRAFT_198457 [Capitella teleta]|eukprot:ELT97936.1 hypothetical protein CAPTEDRAFT_198457 [Capitella teleta]
MGPSRKPGFATVMVFVVLSFLYMGGNQYDTEQYVYVEEMRDSVERTDVGLQSEDDFRDGDQWTHFELSSENTMNDVKLHTEDSSSEALDEEEDKLPERSQYTNTESNPYVKLLNRKNIKITKFMSGEAAAVKFYEYKTYRMVSIMDLTALCLKAKRLGSKADGGWYVCLAAPYAPKPGCLVYSIGINIDWSFDDQIASEMGCTVKSFDPTVKVDQLKHGPDVHMYEIGLGGVDEVNSMGWKMHTLPTLMKVMGDSEKILDYFKIDIEWSEYKSFKTIFKSDIMSRIKQIGIEIHYQNEIRGFFHLAWQLVTDIESHGFRVWAVDHNYDNSYNDSTNRNIKGLFCCSNLYFINTRFLDEFTTEDNIAMDAEGIEESNTALTAAEDAFEKFMEEKQRPDLCDLSTFQGHNVNWDLCLSKGNAILEPNSCEICVYRSHLKVSWLAHSVSRFSTKRLNCSTLHRKFEDVTLLTINSCTRKAKRSNIDAVLLDLEGHEWTILDRLLEENAISKIKQIALVANFDDLYNQLNVSTELFTERQRSIEKFEAKGFLLWKTMPCTSIANFKSPLTGSLRKNCYTIVFLNKRFISQ